MIRLNIKPLSVNQAWQGRRFKTHKYHVFERAVLLMLPNITIQPPEQINLTFGFSSELSDIDNPVKMVLDCLSKKYGFNDRCINRLVIEKKKVEKGGEFIEISFES